MMKQIKVYPLAKASSPPPMEFLNGSNKDINTVFPDNIRYFELLAMLVNEEPSDLFDPSERSQMRAIGIEKGKPFSPDEKTKALLSEAARIRERRRALARDPDYILGIVKQGTMRARELTDRTLHEVRAALGLFILE
jgi:hypothetical protein